MSWGVEIEDSVRCHELDLQHRQKLPTFFFGDLGNGLHYKPIPNTAKLQLRIGDHALTTNHLKNYMTYVGTVLTYTSLIKLTFQSLPVINKTKPTNKNTTLILTVNH